MQSDEYWERRAIENADRRTKETEEFLQYLTTVYNKTYSRITKTIREWYNRYASENDMSMAQAKKQLQSKELQEFLWTVEEYIDKATNDSNYWAKELQRASERVHISRLEALRYQIHTELGVASESAVKSVSDHLGRMYNQEYYRSVFDVFQGTGIGRSFQQMDTRKVQIALERPWAYPSDNFSGRIWTNHRKLINTLDTELTQMIITGEKVDNVVKRVSTKLDSSLSNTSRLVQTEEAHISALARKEAHKELDIERYTFVCTLDERTCPVCGTMDKKTFNESDRKEGINSAPLHPWCRCTDMPYYDDMETGTRTARDGEGKTYRVPENITYEEWKNGLRVKDGNVVPKKDFEMPKKKAKVEPNEINVDNLHPEELGGVKRTKASMTFDEADGKKPNPNYETGKAYQINCQTCVVSYEARLRGYDVEALPNTANRVWKKIMRRTSDCWIDPMTKTNPKYINLIGDTPETAYKWLENNLQDKSRYTIEFCWRGYNSAHIISVEKLENGVVRLYDPQVGKLYDTKENVQAYLNRMVLRPSRLGDYAPKLLKVDSVEFNLPVVNQLLTKGTSSTFIRKMADNDMFKIPIKSGNKLNLTKANKEINDLKSHGVIPESRSLYVEYEDGFELVMKEGESTLNLETKHNKSKIRRMVFINEHESYAQYLNVDFRIDKGKFFVKY